MVSREHIDSVYTVDGQREIAEAFKILNGMRFFEFLRNQNTAPILEGFNEDSPENLAKEILRVRQTNRDLLTLEELGRDLAKEWTNA